MLRDKDSKSAEKQFQTILLDTEINLNTSAECGKKKKKNLFNLDDGSEGYGIRELRGRLQKQFCEVGQIPKNCLQYTLNAAVCGPPSAYLVIDIP